MHTEQQSSWSSSPGDTVPLDSFYRFPLELRCLHAGQGPVTGCAFGGEDLLVAAHSSSTISIWQRQPGDAWQLQATTQAQATPLRRHQQQHRPFPTIRHLAACGRWVLYSHGNEVSAWNWTQQLLRCHLAVNAAEDVRLQLTQQLGAGPRPVLSFSTEVVECALLRRSMRVVAQSRLGTVKSVCLDSKQLSQDELLLPFVRDLKDVADWAPLVQSGEELVWQLRDAACTPGCQVSAFCIRRASGNSTADATLICCAVDGAVRVAMCSSEGLVSVWRDLQLLCTGHKMSTFAADASSGAAISLCQVAEEGKPVEHRMIIWDWQLQEGRHLNAMPLDSANSSTDDSCSMSSDGRWAVSCHKGRAGQEVSGGKTPAKAILWDAESGAKLFEFPGACAAAVSGSGLHLVIGCSDGSLRWAPLRDDLRYAAQPSGSSFLQLLVEGRVEDLRRVVDLVPEGSRCLDFSRYQLPGPGRDQSVPRYRVLQCMDVLVVAMLADKATLGSYAAHYDVLADLLRGSSLLSALPAALFRSRMLGGRAILQERQAVDRIMDKTFRSDRQLVDRLAIPAGALSNDDFNRVAWFPHTRRMASKNIIAGALQAVQRQPGRKWIFGQPSIQGMTYVRWQALSGWQAYAFFAGLHLLLLALWTAFAVIPRWLLALAAVAVGPQLVIMVLQLLVEGWQWFIVVWNLFDLASYTLVFVVLGKFYCGADIVTVASWESFLIYFKTLYYLQLLPGTGPMISVVFKLLRDAFPFLVIVLVLMFAFQIAFFVLLRDEGTVTDTDYVDFSNWGDTLWASFAWLVYFGSPGQYYASERRGTAVALLSLEMAVMPLFIANVLIAIIWDTYYSVRDSKYFEMRRSRAQLLEDFESVLEAMYRLMPFNSRVNALVPSEERLARWAYEAYHRQPDHMERYSLRSAYMPKSRHDFRNWSQYIPLVRAKQEQPPTNNA